MAWFMQASNAHGERWGWSRSLLLAGAGVLLSVSSAQALIIGINTPVTSLGQINFDDTNSVGPPAGITNTGPAVSPWNGATVTMTSTTDPNTGDVAMGDLVASFIPASNTYALNLNNVSLTQLPGNTGYADLTYTFNVEYQLDPAGLPLQPTLYPNFAVSGTVQNPVGSFALVSGFINYSGVNTAGTMSVLETVNYNSLWNTPGPFVGTAVGVPVFGTTPALVGNTTLTLSGMIHFLVDPATINAQSFQVAAAPAPEPGMLGLLALGWLGLIRRRRAG